jgi:hypothetical protein
MLGSMSNGESVERNRRRLLARIKEDPKLFERASKEVRLRLGIRDDTKYVTFKERMICSSEASMEFIKKWMKKDSRERF